jgi:hypothetical protein
MRKRHFKPDGYERTRLRNDAGKARSVYVHRIVATAFILNPEDKRTVDHLDRRRGHNRLHNLRWATSKEQSETTARAVRRGGSLPTAVLQYDRDGTLIKRYASVRDAVEEHGVTHCNLVACAAGRRASCGGYRWAYDQSPDLDGEEWKHWRKQLWVSNLGRCKCQLSGGKFSYAAGPEAMPASNGYPKLANEYIHRLVVRLFVGPSPGEGYVVNHKDGNPGNPEYTNLEWVTAAQNVQHAYDTGLNPKVRAVEQLDDAGNVVERFASIAEAMRKVGGDVKKAIRRGGRAAGFRWRYS